MGRGQGALTVGRALDFQQKRLQPQETHREERQMEENSLHNQHNIVNFLLEVSNRVPYYLWPNSTYRGPS